jgi:di/tricarboxylate transporter
VATAAVLVALAVAAWASGRVPEHLVSVLFFTAAMLLRVAPASVVFSGFTSSALWLIFGGQAMGVAIKHTGLAARVAEAATRRLGARSYGVVVGGVVVLGVLLGFAMPSSSGRVVLLMPIVAAIADRYGFDRPGNGRTAILLAGAFGTHLPSLAVLPANVPNAVLIGAAERQGVTLTYLEYLALHFPVLGLARAAVIAVIVVALFPDRLARRPDASARPPPFSREERLVAAIVLAALALWATDALHHVPAAWVSLAAGAIVLLPPLRLVPERAFNEHVNYTSLFFVAGILGVGAVIAHSGMGRALGDAARTLLPLAPGASARNFAALAALGTALAFVTTSPGLPAVMTPIAAPLAAATALPLKTVLMSEVLGFSNVVLPYQSPPLVIATYVSDAPRAAVLKVSLVLAAATTLALLPADYLWWRALGWLP